MERTLFNCSVQWAKCALQDMLKTLARHVPSQAATDAIDELTFAMWSLDQVVQIVEESNLLGGDVNDNN